MAKNSTDKGGSFYLQSKIYFAKEHLMQDFPEELNTSKFNPDYSASESTQQEAEQASKEGKDNESDARKWAVDKKLYSIRIKF